MCGESYTDMAKAPLSQGVEGEGLMQPVEACRMAWGAGVGAEEGEQEVESKSVASPATGKREDKRG